MNIKPQNNDIVILKRYIFDPLTTIIKLAILKNKHIGTKIAIKDNLIYIQEIGLFQSIVRYYYGNQKSDIHYLSIPIELACAKYLTDEMLLQIPDIVILFTCAQDGLTNLMKTYNDYPIIVHCLKYYFSIIDTYINELTCEKNCILKQKQKSIKIKHNKYKNKDNKEIDENNENKNEKKDIDENITENEQTINKILQDTKTELIELYSDELLIKMYNKWTESKINIILGMIKYLLLETSPINYVKCIETFIIPIDNDIYNIIYEV